MLRTMVDALLDSDAATVRGFTARFAGVDFPGETIRVRAWDESAQVLVSATIASSASGRDGAPVLADAVLTRA